LKLHVDFVIVYGAIEHEMASRGLLKSEISLQGFVPPKGSLFAARTGLTGMLFLLCGFPVRISSTCPT
jgi:hypothetical protein